MLPKLALFAPTINELKNELYPAVESTLRCLGVPTDRILINVGDEKLTSNDERRRFKNLDTAASEDQFILLVKQRKRRLELPIPIRRSTLPETKIEDLRPTGKHALPTADRRRTTDRACLSL